MSASRPIRLVVLFLALCIAYGASRQIRISTDAQLNYLSTRALVLHGDVSLNRYDEPKGFVREHEGRLYSIYGIGVSLIAAPLFFVLVHAGANASVLHAFGSIPFAALAAVLLFVLLERLFPGRRVLVVVGTIAFAFGTTMWPVATTAFWQHAEVALLTVLALLFFFRVGDPRAPLWTGLFLGLCVFVRPATGIAFACGGAYYALRDRRARNVALYVGGAIPALVLMLVANRWLWGSWSGGYGVAGVGFHGDVLRNVPRMLFGWWRGLLAYSPMFVLAFAGMALAFTRRRDEIGGRMLALSVACVGSLFFYARWTTWWGGANQFGYRYLLDVVPMLALVAVYAVANLPRLTSFFVALASVSVATMAAGSAPDKHWWDVDPAVFARTLHGSPLGRAWRGAFHDPGPSLSRLALVALAFGAATWASRAFAADRQVESGT